MSSVTPGPIGPATTTTRGTMSATDKAKVDAITGTNTGDVTLDVASSSWLTIVGQALKLTLVAAANGVAGIVTAAAQDFSGVKTFLHALIASAGIQLSALWNTNGTGASDVGVKVGLSTADGSVNASAKILSVRSGIGGSEVEHAYFTKGGNLNLSYLRVPADQSGGVFFGSCWVYGSTATGYVSFDYGGSGIRVQIGSANGMINQYGTDSSGSPGAATINKPSGKSAIAAGASSVVISNNLIAAGSRVHITPHARDATCKELIAVAASGSFTVSGTANATAALPFSWFISNIL